MSKIMKKFKDLKIGDTVYKVIYAFNSDIPLRIQREKVIAIEEVHSGTVIKTEDIVEKSTLHGTHGYFVDSCLYDVGCTENGNTEIWWDKFAAQEKINNIADEFQRRFTEMLDVFK